MPVAGIVNIKQTNEYDVYIGRQAMVATKWGNPYKIGIHYNRTKCLAMFEGTILIRILLTKEITYEDLLGLSGKVLGCFCAPKRCHGNVIARYVILAEENSKDDFIRKCLEIGESLEEPKFRTKFKQIKPLYNKYRQAKQIYDYDVK